MFVLYFNMAYTHISVGPPAQLINQRTQADDNDGVADGNTAPRQIHTNFARHCAGARAEWEKGETARLMSTEKWRQMHYIILFCYLSWAERWRICFARARTHTQKHRRTRGKWYNFLSRCRTRPWYKYKSLCSSRGPFRPGREWMQISLLSARPRMPFSPDTFRAALRPFAFSAPDCQISDMRSIRRDLCGRHETFLRCQNARCNPGQRATLDAALTPPLCIFGKPMKMA